MFLGHTSYKASQRKPVLSLVESPLPSLCSAATPHDMTTESILSSGTYTIFTGAISGGYVQYPNDTSKWVRLAPEVALSPSQLWAFEPSATNQSAFNIKSRGTGAHLTWRNAAESVDLIGFQADTWPWFLRPGAAGGDFYHICFDESCNYVWVPYAQLGGGTNNDTIRLAARELSANLDTQWMILPLPPASNTPSSTPSSTANSDIVPSTNPSKPRPPVGAIVGGTVGGFGLLCLLVLGILWYRLRKRRWTEAKVAPPPRSPSMTENVTQFSEPAPSSISTSEPYPSHNSPPHPATRRKGANSLLSSTSPNEILSGSAPSHTLSLSSNSFGPPLLPSGSQWSTIGLSGTSAPSSPHDHTAPHPPGGPVEHFAEDSGIRLPAEIPTMERPPIYTSH